MLHWHTSDWPLDAIIWKQVLNRAISKAGLVPTNKVLKAPFVTPSQSNFSPDIKGGCNLNDNYVIIWAWTRLTLLPKLCASTKLKDEIFEIKWIVRNVVIDTREIYVYYFIITFELFIDLLIIFYFIKQQNNTRLPIHFSWHSIIIYCSLSHLTYVTPGSRRPFSKCWRFD